MKDNACYTDLQTNNYSSSHKKLAGVEFLRDVLGNEYSVVPLKLNPKFLHLDVVFTIVNPNLALIYKDGMDEELNGYEKIEVTEDEQFELATNVFVVNEKTIIANSNHKRLENELIKHNLEVIPISLAETAKDGGAFRCTTCPIERE